MKRLSLTLIEKRALQQAANEMLAGELDLSSGWDQAIIAALDRAATKLNEYLNQPENQD